MTPRVTFANACNRPAFFEWHLGSLMQNETSFECVYVGHVDLPAELRGRWPFLRYFKAAPEVTPAQCTAWAMAQARGELLFAATDDCEWDPGLLDTLVALYDIGGDGDHRCKPSPRYLVDEGGPEQDWTPFLRLISHGRPDLPVFPIDGLISRRFYDELGGCDRRFIGCMHFVDLFQRAVTSGGWTMYAEGALHERRTRYAPGYASVCDRNFWQHDRPLLESFWFPGGPASFPPGGAPRVAPLEPYTPEDFARIGALVEEQT